MVLVSHKMEEILGHTDRVTVLRRRPQRGDGPHRGRPPPPSLATMMIGAEHLPEAGEHALRRFDDAPVVLSVENLQVTGDRGMTAVDGAQRGGPPGPDRRRGRRGRQRSARVPGGHRRPAGRQGRPRTPGRARHHRASPRERSRAGLAYVPEDRLGTGLASGLTIEENLVLKSYREPPHSRFRCALAERHRNDGPHPHRAVRRAGRPPRHGGQPHVGRQPSEGDPRPRTHPGPRRAAGRVAYQGP